MSQQSGNNAVDEKPTEETFEQIRAERDSLKSALKQAEREVQRLAGMVYQEQMKALQFAENWNGTARALTQTQMRAQAQETGSEPAQGA